MKALNLLYRVNVPGGGMWSGLVRRQTLLRMIDVEGGVNVGMMAYRAEQPLDRLNIPDTLKAQYTAKLTRGNILMSDMGHALLSVVSDSVGWHDPLGGHSDARMVSEKYGESSYQELRNGFHRNGRDSFLIELGKHGLGIRDMVANVNFFSRVDVDAEGRMTFKESNSMAGATVELRAETDVLIVLNTCQHPMDPRAKYAPRPVDLEVWTTPTPGENDYCRRFRPENARCVQLTEQLHAGVSRQESIIQ